MPRAASAPSAGEGAVGGPARTRPCPRRRVPRLRVVAVFSAAVVVAGLVAYLAVRHREQDLVSQFRPTGLPASVSTSLADLMGLSPVPDAPAPGFALTDQNGRAMSLASFRGRAVVLEFMDPHCVDICPIVSQEFIDAYHDLGTARSRVVFIAVNVNPYHMGVSDVAAYSAEHGLNAIPSWHFCTGPLRSLQAVWRAYNIQVEAPSRNADIIHTSAMFFIDPAGRERFIAAPMASYTSVGKAYLPAGPLAAWGQGIALTTYYLLR